MELDRYKEIMQWFRDNYKSPDFLKDRIVENIARLFESLPDDFHWEFGQNPEFITVKDSELQGPEKGIKRHTIVNPFFNMMLAIACDTTYELVMEKIKSELKTCSHCGTENNKTAKYCLECGKSFKM